jgi:alpha-tubulin suppressor-like RCC1 family protein
LTGVTSIATGYDFTCAVANGGVKCWGSNVFSTLGDGSSSDSSTPTQAVGLTSGVLGVSAADVHACAVKSAGGVACWGSNNWGELGFSSPMDTDHPIDVPGVSNATFIAAGGDPVNDSHTCAITSAKTVICWGINTKGELGRNTTGVGGPVPGPVMSASDVTALSSSGGFSCALTSAGVVLCWGNNDHHQMGPLASGSLKATPVQVTGL